MNRFEIVAIIRVENDNPNGGIDQDGAPRCDNRFYGLISPPSFTRKDRDLVDFKAGEVWKHAMKVAGLKDADIPFYGIAETNNRSFPDADPDAAKNLKRFLALPEKEMRKRYWDVRVHGGTYLSAGEIGYKQSGPIKVSLGVSVAPVDIQTMTITSKATKDAETKKQGTDEGIDRGMAPGGMKFVRHGLYVLRIVYCSTNAIKSECTGKDIAVFLSVLPHIYSETISFVRCGVMFSRLWFIEHRTPLGGCKSDELLRALRPVVKSGVETPRSDDDYDIPTQLPPELLVRVGNCVDISSGIEDMAHLKSLFKTGGIDL
jgi:Cas7 group CRISPR-associated protein Csh2